MVVTSQPVPGTRQLTIPRLMEVRAGALTDLPALLEEGSLDYSRVSVGTGGGASGVFGSQVWSSLAAAGADASVEHGLDGTLAGAARLAATMIEEEVTLAVAVGGGRVIDTVKLAAARSGINLVTCPTSIAHDGMSSPVASLTTKLGERRSFAASMPAGIVVDIDIVASAPTRTLKAGLGDLVSNLTAIMDWHLADAGGTDKFDAFAAMIAENAALSLLDIASAEVPEFHERLAKGLLLSGLAMAVAGTSRPCSGAEHLISHSIDTARRSSLTSLHGEQVALGTLVAAAAHESALLDELRALFLRTGLPIRPADIGLSDDEMASAIRAAPMTRPDRFTVLSAIPDSVDATRALMAKAFGV
jgi:glycerol-1-phosphate dehydrogenase [NAD(P)+]